MEINKGKLIRWVDAKGFGFIKPENGKGDIFIHITAFKGMGRKPVIGDMIHYEIGTDTNGKTRAVNAKIEGVSQTLTSPPLKHKRKAENPTPEKRRTYRRSIKPQKSFNLLPILVVIGIAVFVYNKESKEKTVIVQAKPQSIRKISQNKPQPVRQIEKFQCQGKVWCTEMGSYEEAVFYLRNCFLRSKAVRPCTLLNCRSQMLVIGGYLKFT